MTNATPPLDTLETPTLALAGMIPAFAALFGAGLAANGTYMLADPIAWYFAVPGVTTTGPFNQHFVRDIGLIFALIGLAFIAGSARPAWRASLWGAAAFWLAGHALFHIWEVAVGICGASALLRDFPAVTLPALIAIALAIWAACDSTAPARD
ncbi:hypothetical protein WG901_16400 [Novosphingobium sp. PS1R-30]|uniref:Uncharacterized protein n=1 Tax=Novosphingobium anseongense TaxID=3133436 RepID=A0ABU8RYS3_9SPHN